MLKRFLEEPVAFLQATPEEESPAPQKFAIKHALPSLFSVLEEGLQEKKRKREKEKKKVESVFSPLLN